MGETRRATKFMWYAVNLALV